MLDSFQLCAHHSVLLWSGKFLLMIYGCQSDLSVDHFWQKPSVSVLNILISKLLEAPYFNIIKHLFCAYPKLYGCQGMVRPLHPALIRTYTLLLKLQTLFDSSVFFVFLSTTS